MDQGGLVPGRHLRVQHAHGRRRGTRTQLDRGPGPAAAPTSRSRCRPGCASTRSPTASAQLPGHNRDAFLALARSGHDPLEATSGTQSVGSRASPGPTPTSVGEQQTDDADPPDASSTRSTSIADDARPRERRRGRRAHPVRRRSWSRRWSQAEARRQRGRAADRRGDRQPAAARARRCRSTPRSATRRAAARRCRPTPTRRSTRPTTPTRSRAAAHADHDASPSPPSQAALHPAAVPYLFYVIADKDGVHPLRHHPGRARGQHPPVRGPRRVAAGGENGAMSRRRRVDQRRTRVAGVIGDPVAHSRSPAIHNAAFAAAGLDWVYVAFPARAGRGERGGQGRPRPRARLGLNVTMPHKADAARAVRRPHARGARRSAR